MNLNPLAVTAAAAAAAAATPKRAALLLRRRRRPIMETTGASGFGELSAVRHTVRLSHSRWGGVG